MKDFWGKVKTEGKKVLKQWYTVVISCGIWSLLLYLWSKGIQNGIFVVLNYFTGALLSVDGENIVGGIFGRTIILMVLNTFLASIFMHKGSIKKRLAVAAIGFRSGLKNLNEYVKSFSLFATKQVDVIFAGIMGLGAALICNAFITGNGTFMNSFPCVALFFVLLKQFQAKTGFFLAVINLGARKLGYRDICGDSVVAFFSAFMSGCLIVPILAFLSLSGYSYMVGGILLAIGLIGLLLAKGKKRSMAAGVMIALLLLPQIPVQAAEMENAMEVRFKQGMVPMEDSYGIGAMLEIKDVVVNGEPWTEEEVVLQTDDVFSFKIVSNSIEFLKMQAVAKECSVCGIGMLSMNGGMLSDGSFAEFWYEDYAIEMVFEDVMVYDTGFYGKANGQIKAACNYYSSDVVPDICGNCDPNQPLINYYDYLLGSDNVTVTLSNLDFGGAVFDDGATNIWIAEGYTEDFSIDFSYGNGGASSYRYGDDVNVYQGYGSSFNDVMTVGTIQREKQPEEVPEMSEEVMPESQPVEEENFVEEPIIEEVAENEVSPIIATTVIATSVAGAGVAAAVNVPVTSVIEAKLGMKKKKGTLHVNGDADIPPVRYTESQEVNIPVNIVGADDLKWLITVIAMTPDDGKLVKATAIPLGTDSAQIHLDIAREPKKEVVTYLQIMAFSADVTGECYFHETMAEVTIEK